MSGCILHFGMHKTGTSSIQRSLYHGLADPRFHYVDLGRHNASEGIVGAFSRTPETFSANRKRGRDSVELAARAGQLRARLEAELDASRGLTAVISGEAIPSLKPPELDELVALLRERCGAIRAIGYVRGPRSFVDSVFQQQVKGGRVGLDPDTLFPRYRARFARLEQALSRGEVEYRRFDRADFPQGCVVQDFCARSGIDFPPSAVYRSNESLSLHALRFLYAYRRFGQPHGVGDAAKKSNALLVRKLRELDGPRVRLHRELTDPLMQAHRDELLWMQRRIGEFVFAEPGYEGEDAIRSESDLLRFEAEALRWLARELGRPPDALLPAANDPATVAACIHELHPAHVERPRAGILARLKHRLRNLSPRR